eukprot:Gb_27939 [translate_table: standard]
MSTSLLSIGPLPNVMRPCVQRQKTAGYSIHPSPTHKKQSVHSFIHSKANVFPFSWLANPFKPIHLLALFPNESSSFHHGLRVRNVLPGKFLLEIRVVADLQINPSVDKAMAPFPATRNGLSSSNARITTPTPKPRINNNSKPNTSPVALVNASNYSTDHPVEVVGRIREHPDRKESQQPAFEVVEGSKAQEAAVRVKTEIGYRDFSLDGISLAEKENLEGFYKKFVESRVFGIKTGGRCTIIMYGPTGSGKSHTMFGCAKEPGIVYRALHHILSDPSGIEEGLFHQRLKVKVTVLEIYNEEIFDLLATNVPNIGWFKNGGCRVKLEVMGKKVKNAMFISGSEAGKIAKEVAKVERRRVVKNTLCNERSSRSHCLIILDVPAVGGRLVLVDMAGSENIDQAGSVGLEAKMQTGKINQGNVTLKRVVEAIANGDSHVPYRDSKLTMLLQDSFEDDGAKLLMVLCASPDARDIHKTIGTLEYGAKAKCIVRLPNSPPKEKNKSEGLESVMGGARILVMDEYILKLQRENMLKEKEREEARRELQDKVEEIVQLRAQLGEMEEKRRKAEDELEFKVEERARLLQAELERKCEEYRRNAMDYVDVRSMRMEKHIVQQQQEVDILRKRLEEIESELRHLGSKLDSNTQDEETDNAGKEIKIIPETCLIRVNEQVRKISKVLEEVQPCNMEELQKITNCNGFEGGNHLNGLHGVTSNGEKSSCNSYKIRNSNKDNREGSPSVLSDEEEDKDDPIESTRFMRKGLLPTVFEEEESVEEQIEGVSDEGIAFNGCNCVCSASVNKGCRRSCFEHEIGKLRDPEWYVKDERRTRIENIFLLCGNYREVAARARIGAAGKSKEANKVTKTKVGMQGFTNPSSLSSSDSPAGSQKLTRSVSLDSSMKIYPSQESYSLPSLTLSSSTSPRDFTSPKRLLFGNVLTESNANISKLECEVNKDQLKEMFQTTISINGLSSASALPEIKSISTSYSEYPGHRDYPDNQAESRDKKEDQTIEPQDQKCDVYVKWETSKEASEKLIGIIRIAKDAFLEDLRKMIEPIAKGDFIFLTLRDPSGAPVAREDESSVPVMSLPGFSNQRGSRLACLRLPVQQLLPLGPCYPGVPLNSPENQMAVSSAPATSPVQSSNCNPCLSAAPRIMSNMGNQSPNSAGKIGQKVGSAAQVKGLRL